MAAEPDLFIPERYLKHKEILLPFENHGLGIFVPATELSHHILSGRIAPSIIVNKGFIALIYETAVPENSADVKPG